MIYNVLNLQSDFHTKLDKSYKKGEYLHQALASMNQEFQTHGAISEEDKLAAEKGRKMSRATVQLVSERF